MTTLSARAPAKLNLFLHITGRLPNGYHELESLVVFAEIADEISVGPSDRLSLTVQGTFAADAGGGDNNLVLKAARALQHHRGCAHGAAITLTKNIPVGGGLGGGSADAAAALKLLNRLWALRVTDAELEALAPSLGADVAMCLRGQSAIARGIGELLTPIHIAPAHAVLAHPRLPLLTKDVYAAWATVNTPMRAAVKYYPDETTLALLARTTNDLQAPAVQLQPMVGDVLAALALTRPQLTRMTGSGACCFAIYESSEEAKQAAAQLKTQHPDWWCKATVIAPLPETLSR